MAFFPTYREIVCFPPRVKGLMLESWRQSDQKYSQDINIAFSSFSVSVDGKSRCSYMEPVNNDEECPDLSSPWGVSGRTAALTLKLSHQAAGNIPVCVSLCVLWMEVGHLRFKKTYRNYPHPRKVSAVVYSFKRKLKIIVILMEI